MIDLYFFLLRINSYIDEYLHAGQNIEENDHVKMGQYHTILLEVNQPVRIDKDRWDFIYLERLKEAKDPAAKADVAAIVMQVNTATYF